MAARDPRPAWERRWREGPMPDLHLRNRVEPRPVDPAVAPSGRAKVAVGVVALVVLELIWPWAPESSSLVGSTANPNTTDARPGGSDAGISTARPSGPDGPIDPYDVLVP